jgi:pyruvate/2-oxoglutarate dehydrogenase complex dihydrolipoamide dehydrogenase (E3) component
LDFDLVVIGGGQAGIPLVWSLAGRNWKTALVERKLLGGSCVNFGCTPTKAAIASAKVAHMARRAAEYGVNTGDVQVDYRAVLARARKVAEASRNGIDKGLEGSDNPTLFREHGKLEGREGDRFLVRAGDRVLRARHVVLNTGTRSEIPPIEGLATTSYLHAGNWMLDHEPPTHIVMLGSSYIAMEMAQLYRRLGIKVTVLVRSGEVLNKEDDDVATAMREMLEGEGVRFRREAQLLRVEKRDGGIRAVYSQCEKENSIEASHVFVATGRKPNTEDLGLETVGIQLDSHGFVPVDERLATTVPNLWAAGDIRGGGLFTHTSWDDSRILESQLAGDGHRTTRRIVPYAIFTDPELGRVGMTEAAAKKSGRPLKTARFDMSRSGKAAEIGEDSGFIKVTIDTESREILGAAVLAASGAELVHLFIDVMNARAPYSVIRDAVHIHPTLAEAVQSAVSALDKS